MTDIRSDIEAATALRHALYRRQAVCGVAERADDLRDERAGLEARLRGLWEELREARLRPVRLTEMTPAEARALIRHNPRVVLA